MPFFREPFGPAAGSSSAVRPTGRTAPGPWDEGGCCRGPPAGLDVSLCVAWRSGRRTVPRRRRPAGGDRPQRVSSLMAALTHRHSTWSVSLFLHSQAKAAAGAPTCLVRLPFSTRGLSLRELFLWIRRAATDLALSRACGRQASVGGLGVGPVARLRQRWRTALDLVLAHVVHLAPAEKTAGLGGLGVERVAVSRPDYNGRRRRWPRPRLLRPGHKRSGDQMLASRSRPSAQAATGRGQGGRTRRARRRQRCRYIVAACPDFWRPPPPARCAQAAIVSRRTRLRGRVGREQAAQPAG